MDGLKKEMFVLRRRNSTAAEHFTDLGSAPFTKANRAGKGARVRDRRNPYKPKFDPYIW